MKTDYPFRYEVQPSDYRPEGAFIAVLPPIIVTKSALLDVLASLLAFPPYFGFNWDALFDCFRDFSWVNEHDIVLVHPKLPMLSQPELRVYLHLLRDSVLDWRPEDVHRFDVIFSESDKKAIEQLLSER